MDIGTLTGQISIEDQLSGALMIISSRVEQFAKGFEGAFGVVAVGAGMAVGAITAVTAAVTYLGSRGADVNDVAATLEHFAGSAEEAEAALQGLRSGTLNTVDDFDLMKTSSHLLSAGVKLTATDFGTLGQAAFVLQNRGLGGTKEMLDMVSSAMITGRTRSLQMALGIVDVKDATQELADKLGVEVDQLSKTQKAEATRIQILGMLEKANKDAGVQTRDFGEQIEFAVTQVKNWFDELAQGVAASPKVMGAVDAIGSAFSRAFGGQGKTAMEAIVGWIDDFAEKVTRYAPPIIAFLGDAYGWLVKWGPILLNIGKAVGVALVAEWAMGAFAAINLAAGATTAWAGILAGVNALLLSNPFTLAGVAVGAVYLLNKQVQDGIASQQKSIDLAKDQALVQSALTGKVHLTVEQFKEVEAAMKRINAAQMPGVNGGVADLSTGMKINLGAGAVAPAVLHELSGAAKDLQKSLGGADAKKSMAAMVEYLNALPKGAKLSETAMSGVSSATMGFLNAGLKVDPVIYKVWEQFNKLHNITLPLTKGLDGLHLDNITEEFRYLTRDVIPVPHALGTVSVSIDELQKKQKLTTVTAEDFRKSFEWTVEFKEHIEKLHAYGDALQNLGSQMGGFAGFSVSAIGSLTHVWTSVGDAIDNVGKVAMSSKDKVSALLSGAANVAGATSQGSEGQRVIGGVIAGASAGIPFAAATGGVSIAVGALAGAITGLLQAQHAANEEFELMTDQLAQVRQGIDETYGSFGRAQIIAERFGLSLDTVISDQPRRYWWLTDDLPSLDRQVSALAETLKALENDVNRYGLAWSNFTNPVDRLIASDKAANILLKSFTRLTNAGYDFSAIVLGMSGDVNEWLAATLAAGVKIPPAMEPIIKQLILTQGLTEANARAMLGLADDSVPSLDEITEAAGRYGLKLDELGPKVQQLRLTEVANQIVKDYKTLVAAGVPFDVLMRDTITHVTDTGASFDEMTQEAKDRYTELGGEVHDVTTGMHQSIQDMVDQSLGPLGLELPEAMKLIIAQMLSMGGKNGLVDLAGNALTDLGQLKFQKPLSLAIDELIAKLDELIDKITHGVGGALGGLVQTANFGLIDPNNPWGWVPTPGVPTLTPVPSPSLPPRVSGSEDDRTIVFKVGSDEFGRAVINSLARAGM